MATQDVRLTRAALRLQPDVEVIPGRKLRQRHHEVAPSQANQPLNAPLVIALARSAVAVLDHVVRQKPAEQPRSTARAIRLDARHKAFVIVIQTRQWHPTEKCKGVNVAIDPGLRRRRRIGPNVARIAVRQVKGKEVDLLLHPADHRQRFTEIRLGVTGRVVQRHKHLTATTLLLAHVVLHDRVATGEPVLDAQPIEHPLGRVTLLARTANIFGQPLIDDLTEPVQLRPTDRRRPPIPGRNRKPHDLPHAVARYPKVTCRLSPAHAITARKANLPIQFHGENAPALP